MDTEITTDAELTSTESAGEITEVSTLPSIQSGQRCVSIIEKISYSSIKAWAQETLGAREQTFLHPFQLESEPGEIDIVWFVNPHLNRNLEPKPKKPDLSWSIRLSVTANYMSLAIELAGTQFIKFTKDLRGHVAFSSTVKTDQWKSAARDDDEQMITIDRYNYCYEIKFY